MGHRPILNHAVCYHSDNKKALSGAFIYQRSGSGCNGSNTRTSLMRPKRAPPPRWPRIIRYSWPLAQRRICTIKRHCRNCLPRAKTPANLRHRNWHTSMAFYHRVGAETSSNIGRYQLVGLLLLDAAASAQLSPGQNLHSRPIHQRRQEKSSN